MNCRSKNQKRIMMNKNTLLFAAAELDLLLMSFEYVGQITINKKANYL